MYGPGQPRKTGWRKSAATASYMYRLTRIRAACWFLQRPFFPRLTHDPFLAFYSTPRSTHVDKIKLRLSRNVYTCACSLYHISVRIATAIIIMLQQNFIVSSYLCWENRWYCGGRVKPKMIIFRATRSGRSWRERTGKGLTACAILIWSTGIDTVCSKWEWVWLTVSKQYWKKLDSCV